MTSRRALARSYLLVCCGSLAAFAGDCDEPPPPLYDVAVVELLPPTVHAVSGSSFELEVRLRDSYDRVVPLSFGYEVEWTVGDPTRLEITSSFGHKARLKAIATTFGTTHVKVHVLRRETIGTVTVIPLGHETTGEQVLTEWRNGDPPSAVIVDGKRASCIHRERTAFVGAALIQNLDGPCATDTLGELVVFSIAEEVGLVAPVPWAPGPGVADLVPTPGATIAPKIVSRALAPRQQLKVRLWNAASVTPAVLTEKMKFLSYVFGSNRSGIDFLETGRETLDPASGPATACFELLDLFPAMRAKANEQVVHIIFVTAMSVSGVACPVDADVSGRVVIIRHALGADDVLAHEMGHVLGLTRPGIGHTNNMAGFDATNMMQGGGTGRSTFSLGQSFRMSIDTYSWLNVSGTRTGVTRDCGALASGTRPCPRLALSFPGGP